ncbi:rod shape-determining protein MreC [Cognatiluteimonas profundi]|uniref:rod shape-determining protein MreC n=1 Tax=Cognatiluteimonas profundi TaxID=2594501 RepID=UPI00131D6120|nr:rod shape-determining protein MreC [Lysobacter profundi]
MASFAGSPAARPGDVTGTLRLLAYMALAIALIVLDHRGGWLAQARMRGEMAVQPLWWVASLPGRIAEGMREGTATRAHLADENRILRNALLISGARLSRLQAAAAENARLRGLLGAGRRGGLDVQLAPILNIDLDPTRQRLVLDAGSRDGVQVGQSVIDAGGLLGQIIAVEQGTATVLLITDPDHAVPVVVARTGVRLVAYGKGRSDRMELVNIPLSSDIKPGDSIVTSGLGGRFPAGFPVGTVRELRPDDSHAFLVGELKPAAQLDRGRDVLLLRQGATANAPVSGVDPGAAAGSPAPAPGVATSSAAATVATRAGASNRTTPAPPAGPSSTGRPTAAAASPRVPAP